MTIRKSLLWAWALVLVPCVAAGAAAAGLEVKEPDKAVSLEPRKPQRDRWEWNKPKAEITATGDLKWQPEPVKFEPGASVRYIDFDGGDDGKDGKSKETAWKHHPWDSAAGGGVAKGADGVDTYVFKRGATYRGMLRLTAAGAAGGAKAGKPIRLTSDPAWGTGEAVICGSEKVTGFKQGADEATIPEAEKVWYADLDFAPRCVWEVTGGKVERLNLARTPNWKVTDPQDVMSEWWTWEQPNWWSGACKTNKPGGGRAHIGIDKKHLTEKKDYYVGATVHTEYGIVMGTPFPSTVEAFDEAKNGVIFQGIWFGDSETIITNNRYYLEDKPQYLDEGGEFWFRKKGNGGRLYLRLTGDRDPSTAVVEAARHVNLIDGASEDSLDITGLTFRFTNIHWDQAQPEWGHPDVNNACVRVTTKGPGIRVAGCKFQHAGKAVRITSEAAGMDKIVVADNDMEQLDHGAIEIEGGGQVQVLRNRLDTIGPRAFRQDHSHALVVSFPETMEVAGNVLERCYGAGLFLFGGKASGSSEDRPFARNLVYNNRVHEALLAANDWGSIETWQGGPTYVWNNISANPCGYWNWAYKKTDNNSARLGFAYYLDGAFKQYYFNNVAWGDNNDLTSKLCNHAAFYEAVASFHNAFFNNTAYKFAIGSNWSPGAGRQLFLGNLFLDMSSWVFMHGKLKEDKGPAAAEYPYDTDAYARNVFSKTTSQFAVFEHDGRKHEDAESFTKALAERKVLAGDNNVAVAQMPVRDAEKHDFHPIAGSAAIDRGVKVFVPWALSGMVGEWNFRRNNADPAVLQDDHWCMTPYYQARENYFKVPVFNLKGVNVKAEDFVPGPLEDWCDGALKFNGKDQYASAAAADVGKEISYQATVGKKKEQRTARMASPDIEQSSFLIEAYFQTAPGHTGGALVAKMDDKAGYQLSINKAGGATLSLKAGSAAAQLACGAAVNDGKWHHLIAEVDRAGKKGAIYVDGQLAAQGALDLGEATLSNGGDLLVGKAADGRFFAGAMEFLRIARGTLAEARTSIEELYDWQFDGPFLRDFAGRAPVGKARDAGAFESGS